MDHAPRQSAYRALNFAQLRRTPQRSSSCTLLHAALNTEVGGDEGIRTPDLYVANVPLSQLSYIPTPLNPPNKG